MKNLYYFSCLSLTLLLSTGSLIAMSHYRDPRQELIDALAASLPKGDENVRIANDQLREEREKNKKLLAQIQQLQDQLREKNKDKESHSQSKDLQEILRK